jgi:IS30 family transposase
VKDTLSDVWGGVIMENKWIRAAIPALLIHSCIGSVYCWSLIKDEVAIELGNSNIEFAFSLAIFFLFSAKSKEYSSIISIVDRCSRRVWLIKAEYKQEYYTANLIYNYLIRNEIKVRSITVDNGLEFEALGITAKKLGVKLYKCDPYCSFQRGTNERTNALVRRFIPKGSSMKYVSQYYLDNISFEINSMPIKIFDYKCSYDIELKYK